jgi:uncharacterized membrane protein YfcA
LFFTAMVGGALNAVAGGGSFLTLPALLFAGVPPVSANATATLAAWPGSVASAVAYRREIGLHKSWLAMLVAVSVAGGLVGSLLLVSTSDTRFMDLLPWLLLVAAATFTFGGHIRRLAAFASGRQPAAPEAQPLFPSLEAPLPSHGTEAVRLGEHFSVWSLLLQFPIAVYGGYFGGGMGIMMLATMSIAGMRDIHEMNGLKVLLAVAINAVALAEFMAHGLVAWPPGLVMAAGGILGGYGGAAIARRVDRRHVRRLVIVTAWAMTIYFFLR